MSRLAASNPDFEAVVRESFSRQAFMAHVGAEMVSIEPGYCVLETLKEECLTQQHGFFHGGLVVTLADSAAGYAAYSLFPENSTVLTVDLKTNFLNPANGDNLIAEAEVVSEGDMIYHVKADVYSEVKGEKTLCLTGVFTMMCLRGKADNQSMKKAG